ncbi:MAG: alpha/beta hydrolase, partial [Acidimicrobiales bacterium]
GIIATHYEVDFSEHYLAEHMAALGYGFLGWNTRYRGNGSYFSLDSALVDIGVGVHWLREEAGVDAVVLLGNSGGASLMGAYQARADELGLPRGDLFVSLNAHPGRPDVLTAWLDPSVVDENDPLSVDRSLDMFDPDNGPPYPADFVERYRAAQVARNHRITAWAQEELRRRRAAGAGERVFAVPRAWADLRFADLAIDPSERAAGCYFGDPRTANYSGYGLASASSLRAWLAMWSLAESPCRAEHNLARVAEPALVVQSTGDQGCFPSDAHAILGALAAPDKQLEWVPGDHYLLDRPGSRPEVAALIAGWLADHGAG